jgi:hypothetical protein
MFDFAIYIAFLLTVECIDKKDVNEITKHTTTWRIEGEKYFTV